MSGVLGALPLAVVKIGRHGNDRFRDLLPQVVLGSLLHFLEDHGRDFGSTILLAAQQDLDVPVAGLGHFVRQSLGRFLHLTAAELPTDQPLDRKDRMLWIRDGLAFRDLPDEALPLVGDGDDGGSCPASLGVGDHHGVPAAHDGNAGVRRAQVNSNDLTHGSSPS